MARRARSGRAPPSISRSSACCSTPAPGRSGATAMPSTGARSAAPRGWRSPALRMFAARRVLVAMPAIRCGPMPPRCRNLSAETLRRRLSGVRRQSAARPRRPRRPAAPARRRLSPPRPDVFARARYAAARRAVRSVCAALAKDGTIAAPTILAELLHQLGPIWPSRLTLGGVPLGDCWRHPSLATGDATSGLVPLHKLSQWLAYSLIEPLQTAGIDVTDIDGLTGPRRIPQRRPVHRHRRAGAARSGRRRARARRRLAAGGGMARADRRAARPAGGRACVSGSAWMPIALPLAKVLRRRHLGGRPRASRASAGPTARRRSRSSATARCSERQ